MKSMMSLSMHKAGSSIADIIFTHILTERGYEMDRISKYVSESPLPEHEVYLQYQDKMLLEGVYYGMARAAQVHSMPILEKMKLIAQVRDPRDCITSLYFSVRQSHVPPKDPEKLAAFEARRAELNEQTIDDYALETAKQYNFRLSRLKQVLDTHSDILLLTYEEMVGDTDAWLGKVLDFVGQPMTPRLEKKLERHANFKVDSEDASRHKRQVTPGDHRRKLAPETIAKMNEVMGPMLSSFGYSQ